MSFHPIRIFLYVWLFMLSTVLLGLTAYRTHYTKQKDTPDILTTRNHFYTPIVVELIVTSILGLLWSLWMIFALLASVGTGLIGTYVEQASLWIIWIMYLVGAAIVTSEFSNLQWCRGESKQCRILESIKAFSWLCWGFTTFLILASLYNLFRYVRRDSTGGAYPETRTTGSTRPVTHA